MSHRIPFLQCFDLYLRRQKIDQQNIASLQLCAGVRADHLGTKSACALDGNQVQAGRAQWQFVDTLSHQRRAGLNTNSMLAVGQLVLFDPVV